MWDERILIIDEIGGYTNPQLSATEHRPPAVLVWRQRGEQKTSREGRAEEQTIDPLPLSLSVHRSVVESRKRHCHAPKAMESSQSGFKSHHLPSNSGCELSIGRNGRLSGLRVSEIPYDALYH